MGSPGRFLIGIIMNLCGSIMINTGQNVVKLGHMTKKEDEPSRKAFIRNAGWLLFAVGNVLNFASMAFAPQSTLAALGSIQFVMSPLNAHFLLHEKGALTRGIFLAILIILGGNTLLIIFGSKENEEYDADDLQDLWKSSKMLAYILTAGAGAVVTYIHASSYRVWVDWKSSHMIRVEKMPKETTKNTSMLKPFSFAFSSAAVGTMSVIFAKSLSELLFGKWPDQWINWYTYVVLLVFPATATFWMRRMNKGLRDFDAILIIPLLQCNWMVLSIISGGIYFDEYKDMGWTQYLLFCLGVLVIIVGALVLGLVNFLRQHVEPQAGGSTINRRRVSTVLKMEEYVKEEGESPMSVIAEQRGAFMRACTDGLEITARKKGRRSVWQTAAFTPIVSYKDILSLREALEQASLEDAGSESLAIIEAKMNDCNVLNAVKTDIMRRVQSYSHEELKLWMTLEKGEAQAMLNEAEPLIRGSMRTLSIFTAPQISATFQAEEEGRLLSTQQEGDRVSEIDLVTLSRPSLERRRLPTMLEEDEGSVTAATCSPSSTHLAVELEPIPVTQGLTEPDESSDELPPDNAV
eukprot:Rmarinus@m.6216